MSCVLAAEHSGRGRHMHKAHSRASQIGHQGRQILRLSIMGLWMSRTVPEL
jgi:hypothetical protein